MREYDPCIGCEYYNKPYWSVVSPCKNCHKTYGCNDYIVTTTTNINGLIVDDLVEDLNKFIPLSPKEKEKYTLIGNYIDLKFEE